MKKVSLIVITDGRQDCIKSTIDRLNSIVSFNFFEKIIINDSANVAYHNYLSQRFIDFKIVSHETRRGLAGAVQSAWNSYSKEAEFIFHLEDDFLFNEEPNIDNMITLLEQNKYLAQMALVRAPVNPPEEQVGGFVFQHLEDYHQKDGFFEHQRLFTLNPSIYPVSTAEIGWPDHGGETEFTNKVHSIDPEKKFGFYGNIYDKPKVTHIGGKRSEGWFL